MDPDDQSNIPTKPVIVPGAGEPSDAVSDSIAAAMLGAGRSSGAAWQPPSPEELQRDFPLYEIRAVLGRGGMGAVYKGWQKSLDRFVAIKILPPGFDDGVSDFTERFKREAKAMAHLHHPGIVAVFDAGTTPGGLLYFVMECVEGTDVQRLVAERGRLDPAEALRITSAVCDALGYAHEHGVIHRDIKPSNIMLETGGTVKVADFGLAKTLGAETTMLTMSNVAMGTPDFMAPEALKGAANADHRADIYAVGVMLYQMLTGELPRGRFVPPSRAVPGLDRRLDLIVDKALQPEPAARYSSAIELRTALEPVTRAIAKRAVAIARASAARKKPSLLAIAIAIAALGIVAALIHFAPRKKAATPEESAQARKLAGISEVPKSPASQVSASATTFPPGKWVPAFTSPAELPPLHREKWDRVTLTDGWFTDTDRDGAILALSAVKMKNLAIRARLRWPESDPLLRKIALTLRRDGDYRAGTVQTVEFKSSGSRTLVLHDTKSAGPGQLSQPTISPPYDVTTAQPGKDFTLEIAVIGTRVIGKLDGRIVCDGTTSITAPGSPCITTLLPFRDLEILSLDGLPEAEALKLAGVDAAKQSKTTQWRDALAEAPLKEVIAKADHNAQGWLLPVGEHWVFPDQPLRDGALRIRATEAPGALAELCLFPGDPVPSYHARFDRNTGECILDYNPKPGEGSALARKKVLPAEGKPYEFLLARVAGQLHVALNGEVILRGAGQDALPGKFGINCIPKYATNVRILKAEYLNLDGLPEAEALNLVGISEVPQSPSPPVSPSSTLTFAGHRYQFVPSKASWSEAKAQAEALGGHLATITSAEEHAWFMQAIAPLSKHVWLGGRRQAEDGSWAWITGEPWKFTAWARHADGTMEPVKPASGAPLENILEFGYYPPTFAAPGWNDEQDRARAHPDAGYLVEWDSAGK